MEQKQKHITDVLFSHQLSKHVLIKFLDNQIILNLRWGLFEHTPGVPEYLILTLFVKCFCLKISALSSIE